MNCFICVGLGQAERYLPLLGKPRAGVDCKIQSTLSGDSNVPPGPPKIPKQILVSSSNGTFVLLLLICICCLV